MYDFRNYLQADIIVKLILETNLTSFLYMKKHPKAEMDNPEIKEIKKTVPLCNCAGQCSA